MIDCGSLRSPVNGDVDFVRTTFGAIAFYSCDTGFFLQGFATRTCQANGLWSNSEPTCERKSIDIIALRIVSKLFFQVLNFSLSIKGEVRCATLEDPENGVVVTTGETPGSSASYDCNLGYRIQGDTTRTCQQSGLWTGVAPTCNRMSIASNYA